jgi:hypothetical protein
MRFHALGSFAAFEQPERRLPPLRSVLSLGQHVQPMRPFRIIAALLVFVGLLYCGWALHRMGPAGMLDHSWPRPFPYPDTWLDHYEHWLDLRYPASPGTLKLHGEIFRVQLTLWAIVAALVSMLVLAVAPALRKLKSQQGAARNSRRAGQLTGL